MFFNRLNKTWLIDIDGTIVFHAGLENNGYDVLLKNVKETFQTIPKCDKIILLTARSNQYEKETKKFLIENNIRFDDIIFNLGTGERILINDKKPSGYITAYAESVERNVGINLDLVKKYI